MTPKTIYNINNIPMKPEKKYGIYDRNWWWYSCPSCHEPIDYKQKMCGMCAQKINWDGEQDG